MAEPNSIVKVLRDNINTLNIEQNKDIELKHEASSSSAFSILEADTLNDRGFVNTKWPISISTHRPRCKVLSTEKEGVLCFVQLDEPVRECFICKEDESNGPLSPCGGSQNGVMGPKKKRKCFTLFHVECLMEYNASDFNASYIRLPECQNELLCPLHFCDHCYSNRRRQTAFVGDLIECTSCYRSFHKETCLPAGGKDVVWLMEDEDRKDVHVEMVICPSHCSLEPPQQHLSVCCECEKDEGQMTKCRKCIRSFHPACSTIKEVDDSPKTTDLCESCLFSETIPFDKPCIALWKKIWYPCFVREWNRYPSNNRTAKLFDAIGYTVVEWGGFEKMYSIMPLNQIMPMFGSSYNLLGKKRNAVEKKAWREMLEMDDDDKYKPLYKDVRKPIQTSYYYNKELLASLSYEDTYLCDCKTGNEGRCGSQCSNRIIHYECPPECSKLLGGCNNRSIQMKAPCPNIERRKTERKGYGIFATEKIKAGTFIAEYAGEIINQEELEKRLEIAMNSRDNETHLYMMMLRANRTVDAARAGNIARYINHSCSPNCQLENVNVVVKERGSLAKYDQRVAIRAVKDIDSGEEVTFSYSMLVKGVVTPKCRCGAKNCKGTLGEKASSEVDEEKDEKKEVKITASKLKRRRSSKGSADSSIEEKPPKRANTVKKTKKSVSENEKDEERENDENQPTSSSGRRKKMTGKKKEQTKKEELAPKKKKSTGK